MMPTYTFRNNDTMEVHEKFMKHSDKKEYLEKNLNYEELVGSPALQFDSARLGRMKPDDTFREVLAKVHENCVSMGGSCKTKLFDR